MKALIVDDDRVLADVVAFALRREGFQVIQAYDGAAELERWAEDGPDIVILDINLPKIDGFTVCQRIRREADTPIIMLTVRSEDSDVVHGLEIGADDFISKPFSPRQLVARAQAVLRRAGHVSMPSPIALTSLTAGAAADRAGEVIPLPCWKGGCRVPDDHADGMIRGDHRSRMGT
jgi:DNA-binding response OmpR family regulator